MNESQRQFNLAHQALWDHMATAHGLHLLESELYEIELLAATLIEARKKANRRKNPKLEFQVWFDYVKQIRNGHERTPPSDFQKYHAQGLGPLQALDLHRRLKVARRATASGLALAP